MNSPDDSFVPDDPALYGPDPSTERRNRRPLRDILGVTPLQLSAIVALATILFIFLGGPVWSAARATFPFRLFASYLIIPFLAFAFLSWNGRGSLERWIATSFAAAGAKFALTVVLDVLHGLARHWPP
jgi:hypothetical protein